MKNVLITGASGDIGSEIAKNFASLGYRLLLVYNHNFEKINDLSTKLSAITETAIFKCDLSKEEDAKNLIDEIIKKFKRIDVLVNSAGVSLIKQIQDTKMEDYDFIFNNNVKSTINTIKFVVPFMISEKYGKIINISSMWGKVGASMESLYSASKGAINSLTLSLAKELGPSNINVNAVCPGLIKSKMNANIEKEAIDEIIASTPLNRIGSCKDVANLVEFLSSDKADFITGQIISVDGGFAL